MTPQEIRRLGFFLDGLRYSIAMAKLAASRVTTTLDALAKAHCAQEPTDELVTSALLDIWTIVDMCHRARELVQQTPGLSPKLPEIQIFLRSTASVEDSRNYVQHFRSEIPSIPATSSPLWGTISWVPTTEPMTCYTMMVGNLLDGLASPSISFDRDNLQFTSRVHLSAGVTGVDPLVISGRLDDLAARLIRWLDQHPTVTRHEAQTLIWKMSMVPHQRN